MDAEFRVSLLQISDREFGFRAGVPRAAEADLFDPDAEVVVAGQRDDFLVPAKKSLDGVQTGAL